VLANRKRSPSFRGEGFINRAFGVVRYSGACACGTGFVLAVTQSHRPYPCACKELVRDYCAINPSLFQTSVTFQTEGLRKTHLTMHMSLNCSFPVTQIGKLVAVRIGRAAGQGDAVKVVKPLARRGQWLLPAKWLRLPWNICEVHSANDALGRDTPISRIEFRLQELKGSEPPAHTRRLSWDC
jgi:hypothetical protein